MVMREEEASHNQIGEMDNLMLSKEEKCSYGQKLAQFMRKNAT